MMDKENVELVVEDFDYYFTDTAIGKFEELQPSMCKALNPFSLFISSYPCLWKLREISILGY